MKRASSVFKVHPDKAGWIRTTLCPVNDKHDSSFRVLDIIMFLALVLGTVAIARMVIAH